MPQMFPMSFIMMTVFVTFLMHMSLARLYWHFMEALSLSVYEDEKDKYVFYQNW